VRSGRSALARPVAGPSFLVGDRHDDDFANVEAVVNGEREAAEDAFVRMRATRPASRRFGDFFDDGTDDSPGTRGPAYRAPRRLAIWSALSEGTLYFPSAPLLGSSRGFFSAGSATQPQYTGLRLWWAIARMWIDPLSEVDPKIRTKG
jgi:hypothetical protein